MEEIWKDIDGFEGLYQVSNFGNVMSLNYGNRGYAKKLTPKCNNSGRLWVELLKGGKRKCMLVHRLVALAFIPNPNNFPQINHKDENPKNNFAFNLEWCTQSYNNHYSIERHPEYSIYLRRKKRAPTGAEWHRIHDGENRNNRKPSKLSFPVLQYDKAGKLLKKWETLYSAYKENNWNASSIKECCEMKRKTAYGFIWRYVS